MTNEKPDNRKMSVEEKDDWIRQFMAQPVPEPRPPKPLDWSPAHLRTLPFMQQIELPWLGLSLRAQIRQAIQESSQRLLSTYEVSCQVASSGASMFDIDEIEFSPEDVTIDDEGVEVDIEFSLSGEPDDDCRAATDSFGGEATVLIDINGRVTFQDVSLGPVRYLSEINEEHRRFDQPEDPDAD
jgi:hypothetical protein